MIIRSPFIVFPPASSPRHIVSTGTRSTLTGTALFQDWHRQVSQFLNAKCGFVFLYERNPGQILDCPLQKKTAEKRTVRGNWKEPDTQPKASGLSVEWFSLIQRPRGMRNRKLGKLSESTLSRLPRTHTHKSQGIKDNRQQWLLLRFWQRQHLSKDYEAWRSPLLESEENAELLGQSLNKDSSTLNNNNNKNDCQVYSWHQQLLRVPVNPP